MLPGRRLGGTPPRAEEDRSPIQAARPLCRPGFPLAGVGVTLAEAAAQADALAGESSAPERAQLRTQWGDELEGAARSEDYRERAVAYRAIGQFRFRQKQELIRRGLEDESPACRGSGVLPPSAPSAAP